MSEPFIYGFISGIAYLIIGLYISVKYVEPLEGVYISEATKRTLLSVISIIWPVLVGLTLLSMGYIYSRWLVKWYILKEDNNDE